MRSVEEKTPSVAGLLSPDGSPRIDISKSLRKKRDPTAIRQGLLKTSLDVRLDYAPISVVSPTGSIVSSRSPTGSTKDGEFDEGTGLKEAQNEPVVFYNTHAKEGDMSFSDSARCERPLRKKPTALIVEDMENFTFQNSKDQVAKEEEILENEPLDDRREIIRFRLKQERLAREEQKNNNYVVTIEEPPKEEVHEEPQRKKKKKHKKSEEIPPEPEVIIENKSKKLKEIQEIVEEEEQTQIVDRVGLKGVRKMLQERRKESNKEEEQKVEENAEKIESLVHETLPKKHSKSRKSKHKKSEEEKQQHSSDEKGRSSENLDHHTRDLKLSKVSSQETVKDGEKKSKNSNLRKMVIQRQASQTLHEHPEKASPLLTGDSIITGTYGYGGGSSALLTNDHPLLIKGTTPESMNFTTAVSILTTSRKRDSIIDGKEIKEKVSKEKKKSKHHHHHKHHEKHEKSKKSSKKKKHRGEHGEDNVPLSSDFKQQEGGGESQTQTQTEITPVIRPALLTDGLDLVKLMLDRRNRKKSKFIIVLFTLLVVLTLILNGLEMAKFNSTYCEGQTYAGVIYASFAIMVILKIFCISLFNLELTYKQSYNPLTRMLYPFLVYFLCPLLQLPQNVYNYNTCIETNKVINMKQSWSYVGGILGSLAVSFLYFGVRKSVKRASTQVSVLSRACEGVSNIIKFLMILSLIAWNVILFVLFGGQKVFMLSLFFDFLVYLILGFSIVGFLVFNHKWGENYVADSFVKIESEEVQIARAAEKLNNKNNANGVEGGGPVEIVIKDEQGNEAKPVEVKHELDDIKIQVH